MYRPNRTVTAVVLSLSLVATGGVLAGCGDDREKGMDGTGLPARTVVDEATDASGVRTSSTLVSASPIAVVAAPDPGAQGWAASAAVALRAPMLTLAPGSADAVRAELDRLGAGQVLTVGQVDGDLGGRTTIAAPTDEKALEKTVGVTFHDRTTFPAARIDDVTVHQNADAPALIDAGPVSGPSEAGEHLAPRSAAWSGDSGPVVLVTDRTPVAAIATAVATGAHVAHLGTADPRVDGGAVQEVSTDRPIVALGPGWGDADLLGQRIEAAKTGPQLPGGGQLVFPGRRFVAAYGSPITPALGILGEQNPTESVARVKKLVDDYRPYSPEQVVPAFEIIGTVASSSAGADNNFTNEWPPEDFLPLVDAITAAGGYAVIDLQPGLATLLDQAKPFAELLKRPNVGLALDAEWKMEPGQKPAEQVGHADAAEFNQVITWLADLTRDSGGPQKLLILHQFQSQMIRNREKLDVSRPELAIALHADGHGTPDLKMGTWHTLLGGLQPEIWPAWKNFYDEDTPTFTPEQTMAVEPRPWFVSYQ